MQFRPWRLITVQVQQRFRAIPGDSGRSAVPQMTHTPQLACYFSCQLRSATAGRSPVLLLRPFVVIRDAAPEALDEDLVDTRELELFDLVLDGVLPLAVDLRVRKRKLRVDLVGDVGRLRREVLGSKGFVLCLF